jgi:hypothetical protein
LVVQRSFALKKPILRVQFPHIHLQFQKIKLRCLVRKVVLTFDKDRKISHQVFVFAKTSPTSLQNSKSTWQGHKALDFDSEMKYQISRRKKRKGRYKRTIR